MSNGRYIVIEGPQGTGKSTQIDLLAIRLREEGYPVRLFREPDSQSNLTARTLRMLTQDPRYPMNSRTETLLYNAARSQSLDVIREARANGVICLCDRNYLSTLAIQYYGRGDIPDYETITRIIDFAVGDMQPDLTIVLDAPVAVLRARAKERGAGERFDNLDEAFLERVRAGYLWEAKQRDYPVVFADSDRETVTNELWKLLHGQVKPLQAQTSIAPPISIAPPPTSLKTLLDDKKVALLKEIKNQTADDTVYVTKDKTGGYTITDEGRNFLEKAVTSASSDVYAFTDKLTPTTIAAAMARLSRRSDDMRITLLDEFAGALGKDEKLLQRVITAYGDDSVQQLVGQHIVVENASNILTKKLEWGRLASYLEQSTRYIYFDQKDASGAYRYVTPDYLPKALKVVYQKTMDEIFDLYSQMVHSLTEYVREHNSTPVSERDSAWQGATRAQACDAVRAVLPVATKATVGIFASGQALESLITHLLSDELPEARQTGEAILTEARKTIPTFLERADKPDRGGATIAYKAQTSAAVRKLASSQLPATFDALDDDVQLIDYWPKNELALLPHMLYEHSCLGLNTIKKEMNHWSYNQKIDAFNTYIGDRLNRRHKPGRALEIAHYSFDLICDYGIFRDLQRHRIVDGLAWQQLTPRYGFDIPELIEKSGLTDKFEACFDKSAALYSALQAAGYHLEAQYATLLGHRMRWKITYNAREAFHLHELRTSPQGHPGYRKLVKEMHDKVADVHPMLAQAMKFVNKGEDEELSRLAAERYTQYKLEQLN
jgi:dTMP kinase